MSRPSVPLYSGSMLGRIALAVGLTGCASHSLEMRVGVGSLVGGALGAAGGTLASPNEASKPWNAVIWGLVGALAGGPFALLTRDKSAEKQPVVSPMKEFESGVENSELLRMPAPNSAKVPPYLKERLSDLVVEELKMPDQVSEDGTLHEPHKAYRIRRQPELLTKPRKKKSPEVIKPGASK